MAEAFLNQLPRVGRGVLGKEDQRCLICMEEYGTIPSSSGTIERAVKLPCNHILGSECISIWVSPPAHGGDGHNTCPVCRHVLFQLPPHNTDGHRPSTRQSRADHSRIHAVLTNQTEGIAAQLGLDRHVGYLARWFANHFHDRVSLEWSGFSGRHVLAVAAASVYMASHLLGHPTTLGMISSILVIEDQAVKYAYDWLLDYRYEILLAPADIRSFIPDQERIDALLPAVPS